MQPVAVTQLALLARLLERGTSRLSDLRALNRHTDWLYGAALSAQAIAVGPFQLLHLHYDAVDEVFVPDAEEDLLACGMRLLGEVLTDPFLEDGRLPDARVEQEKSSLRRYVDSVYADRSLLAQRRAMERMCAGSPWALLAHGDPAELCGLDGSGLLQLLRDLIVTVPMHVYVCGNVNSEQVADLCTRYLPCVDRADPVDQIPDLPSPAAPRRVRETDDVSQGRLVLGFRTNVSLRSADGEYAALVLLNLLFGGDAHSRLYSRIREDQGLCYYIGSYTEPMSGLLFVEAGVEPADQPQLLDQVLGELLDLATVGPTALETQRSKELASQRLESAEDGRDGLVRFHLSRRLAGVDTSRRQLLGALESVTPAQIRAVAASTVLDTEYYLAPRDVS
jgi:predicted Zn-dependent peptidase